MKIEKRIERARRKTMRLFDKKNEIRNIVRVGLENELDNLVSDNIKKLDKANKKYNKAYAKFEKLEIKNNSRKICITEGLGA